MTHVNLFAFNQTIHSLSCLLQIGFFIDVRHTHRIPRVHHKETAVRGYHAPSLARRRQKEVRGYHAPFLVRRIPFADQVIACP